MVSSIAILISIVFIHQLYLRTPIPRNVCLSLVPNTFPGSLFCDSVSALALLVAELVLVIRVSALCRHLQMEVYMG